MISDESLLGVEIEWDEVMKMNYLIMECNYNIIMKAEVSKDDLTEEDYER